MKEEPKLKIRKRKYTGETGIISMRIAKDMLADVDAKAAQAGRTRNELLAMCIEFALEHMEVEE